MNNTQTDEDEIFDPQIINDPFSLFESQLGSRAIHVVKSVLGVLGAVSCIIGLALLLLPSKTLVLFAVAISIYFIISGVVRIIGAIVEPLLPAGWRVLGIILGLVLLIGGIAMIRNPQVSTASLTFITVAYVGIGWIIEGILGLAESWGPRSGWAIAASILSIIAGVIVLIEPFSSAVMLIAFAGIMMIVLGVISLYRAFTFGKIR